MSLYQQAMLQALGIQQYTERHTSSNPDLASTSEDETPVPAPQELPPQKTYPQVPDMLIRYIQIALGMDVSVNFGTEIMVTNALVTLPYPFSASDKPMLLKALHGYG